MRFLRKSVAATVFFLAGPAAGADLDAAVRAAIDRELPELTSLRHAIHQRLIVQTPIGAADFPDGLFDLLI